MSDYEWIETRLRAMELFTDSPSAAQEQRVLDVFLEHPALVVEAVEHVGRRFAAGQVRNPWAILAKHVEEAVRPLDNPTVSDERDRDKAVRRAEQWMRAAGKHYPSWAEVEDALFGDTGYGDGGASLRPYDSPQLRERMAKLYRQVEPEGALIEEQAEMRARAYMAGPSAKPEQGMEDEPGLEEEFEVVDGEAVEEPERAALL